MPTCPWLLHDDLCLYIELAPLQDNLITQDLNRELSLIVYGHCLTWWYVFVILFVMFVVKKLQIKSDHDMPHVRKTLLGHFHITYFSMSIGLFLYSDAQEGGHLFISFEKHVNKTYFVAIRVMPSKDRWTRFFVLS